ncbi:hypothetical protein PLESTM_000337100 [Pleodorina starrii]|nr:hypothetical protein PLESTM_000337100 [Pleodorina starrii]
MQVGNLNIYSDVKGSIELTTWNVEHRALIPSNLTQNDRRLSQPQHKRPESEWPQSGQRFEDPDPRGVKIVIGIYTAPTAPGTEPRSKYDYNYRRQLAREMWIRRARRYRHLVVKFLVGVNPDPVKHASMLDEQEKYGDIMIVQMNDSYAGLTDKSRHFFQKVFRDYPAVEWVVKMDDDVYLLPERLLQAADQWAAAGADYIGCFSTGPVYPELSHRWHEPNAIHIGEAYAWRAQGPIYVLSRRVVRDVVVRRFDHLRLSGSAEGTHWRAGGGRGCGASSAVVAVAGWCSAAECGGLCCGGVAPERSRNACRLVQFGSLPYGFLSYGSLAYGSLAYGSLAYGSLSYGSLAYGSLSYGSLAYGSLSYGSLAYGSLPYGFLSYGSLAYGSLTYGSLTYGSLTYGSLAYGSLAYGSLAYGSLTYGSLAYGSLAYGSLAYGSLAYGSLTYGSLAYGSLAYGSLAYGSLAYGSLAYGSLAYGSLTFGSLVCRATWHGAGSFPESAAATLPPPPQRKIGARSRRRERRLGAAAPPLLEWDGLP